MNVKQHLIDLLTNEFGYPVYLQNSLADDADLPETFFTFFNNETYDESFFDNLQHQTVWNFDLNVYSRNPEITNTILYSVKALLKQNGWLVDGVGYDLVSDDIEYTGRGIEIIFVERSQN